MDDLIIIKDSFAVRRSSINRVSWQDSDRRDGTKYLDIGFDVTHPNAKVSWNLFGDEALEFWQQFTGQIVSWDERPIED